MLPPKIRAQLCSLAPPPSPQDPHPDHHTTWSPLHSPSQGCRRTSLKTPPYHAYKLFLREHVLMHLPPSSWMCVKIYKHLNAYENEIIQMSLQMLQMASQYSINAKKISSPTWEWVFANETRKKNDQIYTHSWWRWLFSIPIVRISILKNLKYSNFEFLCGDQRLIFSGYYIIKDKKKTLWDVLN